MLIHLLPGRKDKESAGAEEEAQLFPVQLQES